MLVTGGPWNKPLFIKHDHYGTIRGQKYLEDMNWWKVLLSARVNFLYITSEFWLYETPGNYQLSDHVKIIDCPILEAIYQGMSMAVLPWRVRIYAGM